MTRLPRAASFAFLLLLLSACHKAPAEDVALYLSTLLWQDPETWGGLNDVPELRPNTAPSAS